MNIQIIINGRPTSQILRGGLRRLAACLRYVASRLAAGLRRLAACLDY